MACRFPGEATTLEEFWRMLCAGEEGIIEVPKDRWSIERFYDPNPAKKGKTYVKHGGYLRQPMDQMDALFFGISPREADVLDPQQRLILEVAWEATEDAGIVLGDLAGSNCGVYIGGFMLDHLSSQTGFLNRELVNAHSAVSFSQTMLSARISYMFDLRGPCLTIDTACSSSLVAIDLAAKSIWNGDCTLAFVGGISIMYRAETPATMAKGQFLSKDGRSKSFDSRGDGYGRGEGAGIVILKPLAQAEKDGDLIYATIAATGTNYDGRTESITVPNPDSQVALIHSVMSQANIKPCDVAFVEAHGTGTALGDPLECQALSDALETCSDNPKWVGSVKANIGHLEPAAGIAGLIKASLCLSHQSVPPVANLETPNPNIPFEELGIRLPRRVEPLLTVHGQYAAINSFGYGGTNAHAILKNYVERPDELDGSIKEQTNQQSNLKSAFYFLPISARSEAALQALAGRYAGFMKRQASNHADVLTDICYSAATRREHHRYRLGLIASSIDEMHEQLSDFSAGKGQHLISAKSSPEARKPVMVMTGMGPQWWAMGQELLRTEAVFKQAVKNCDAVFSALAGWSILEEMTKNETESKMDKAHIAQPGNFVVQIGLYELLRSNGIEPAAIVGHSVGEVSAAYAAGVLSLEDAICVSFHRSRLQRTKAGRGAMLAIGLPADEVKPLIAYHGENNVSIAAINSWSSVTLSGDNGALQKIAGQLTEQEVFNRFLKVEIPYHSPVMDELYEELIASLRSIQPRLPEIPLYSTVIGKKVEQVLYDAEYWYQNIRQPVYFADAIVALGNAGHDLFLEIGPHPVLASSINEVLNQIGRRGQTVASLRRKQSEQFTFYQTVAELYCHGATPDWKVLYPDGGRFIRLPSYPWQRQHYWSESKRSLFDRLGDDSDHPILGHRQNTPNPIWNQLLNAQFMPWLPDHKVQGLVIFPGAAYIEVALQLQNRYLKLSSCTLENIHLRRALAINEPDEPILYTEYIPRDQQFKIYSGKVDDQCWNFHTDGYLSTIVPEQPDPIQLSLLRGYCTEAVDIEVLYARLAKSNLQYGTAFRTIRQVFRGEKQILIKVCAAEKTKLGGYTLHPTLLDAAFQSLIGIVSDDDDRSFMPVRIEKIDFFKTPNKVLWVHSRLSGQDGDTMLADIDLFDETGTVFATIRGLSCQAVENNRPENNVEEWLYEIDWELKKIDKTKEPQTGNWLLFMDKTGVADKIANRLIQAQVSRVIRVYSADEFRQVEIDQFEIRPNCKEDLACLLDAVDANALQGVMYGWTLDLDEQQDIDGTVQSMGMLNSASVLMSKLDDAAYNVNFHVLSCRAQSLASQFVANGIHSAQASVVGLARVIANEYSLRSVLVDIDGELTNDNLSLVVEELLTRDDENEVAIYKGQRYVYRLKRWHDEVFSVTQTLTDQSAISLVQNKDQIYWQQMVPIKPVEGEIQVYIEYMILPKEFRFNQNVLTPIIGKVVSSKHRDYRPNEVVLVFAASSKINSYIVIPPSTSNILKLDRDQISTFSDSSRSLDYVRETQPNVISYGASLLDFAYALYALEWVVKLEQGMSILIHASQDNSDLAAAQIALTITQNVVVTYQDENKQVRLEAMGVKHVISLQADKALAQIQAAYSCGYDVIINTLTGEQALKTLILAKPLGKVIMNSKSQLNHPVPKNIQLLPLDMEVLKQQAPQQYRQLLQIAMQRMNDSTWSPPSILLFTANEVKQALVANCDSTVALSIGANPSILAKPLRKRKLSLRQGSYLITGGFGGFGLKMALWFARNGVKNLVMVGRKGAVSEIAKQTLTLLISMGVDVMEARCDVSDEEQVASLIEKIQNEFPPLVGVFHTAAVLDDAMLIDLTQERLSKVMGPKARGAWYLHQHTKSLSLDYFVLFSSLSSIVGKPGQGNYVAANAYLDQLAHHRQSLGLPAISLNWGVLAEVGLTAEQGFENRLEKMGVGSYTVDEAMEMLEIVLDAPDKQLGLFNLDWKLFCQTTNTPSVSFGLRYGHLIDQEWLVNDTPLQMLHHELKGYTESERREYLSSLLTSWVSNILRLPEDNLDIDVSLNDFGLDSLMAIELQTAIEVQTGVGLSVLELIQDNTIDSLTGKILTRLNISSQ